MTPDEHAARWRAGARDPDRHRIMLWSGRIWSYDAPKWYDVTLDDIAHALARIQRWCGHARSWASVAEHSVRVAERVRRRGGTPTECLLALLHDAEEAYCQDVPSPLKAALRNPLEHKDVSAYDRVAADTDRCVRKAFGLPPLYATSRATEELIRQADMDDLRDGADMIADEGWAPEQAEDAFLYAACYLVVAVAQGRPRVQRQLCHLPEDVAALDEALRNRREALSGEAVPL